MEWFSLIDLKEAFSTIELSEASKPLTIFSSKEGLYMSNILAMGLSVSPELFQTIMTEKLADLQNKDHIHDDILVYGKTKQQALEATVAVLERIREHGLTVSD